MLMTAVTITQAPLEIEDLLAVVDGAPVKLDEATRARIAASRALVDESLRGGEAVYGLTTNGGARAGRQGGLGAGVSQWGLGGPRGARGGRGGTDGRCGRPGSEPVHGGDRSQCLDRASGCRAGQTYSGADRRR